MSLTYVGRSQGLMPTEHELPTSWFNLKITIFFERNPSGAWSIRVRGAPQKLALTIYSVNPKAPPVTILVGSRNVTLPAEPDDIDRIDVDLAQRT